jgi:hypothetical protein
MMTTALLTATKVRQLSLFAGISGTENCLTSLREVTPQVVLDHCINRSRYEFDPSRIHRFTSG